MRWFPLVLVVLVIAASSVALGLAAMDHLGAGEAVIAPVRGEGRDARGSVVARGHIEPRGGVTVVSGLPENLSTVAIVDRLLVREGDRVAADQVLAVLNGYDVSLADLHVSEANLRVAQLQRDQVAAGIGKTADLAAQANVVASRQAQLRRVERDHERTNALVQRNVASVQALDASQAALDGSRQDLQQAQNVLRALTEVRSVDNALANGQVALAEASLLRAHAVMRRLEVRAHAAGTVLSVQVRSGEMMSSDGILRLGDLEQLVILAEVDENQVGRIRLGSPTTIEGAFLDAPVQGTVSRISREVFRQKRPSSDILVGRDARVVEVEVTPRSPLPEIVGAEVGVRIDGPSANR